MIRALGSRGARLALPALWLAMATCLFLAAPGLGQVEGPFCRPAVVVSKLPRGAQLDSTWANVEPGLQVTRIVNRRNSWAAAAAWFQLDARPGEIYTFEQLDSLLTFGLITEESMLSQVRYTYLVKSAELKEAKLKALEKRPKGVPAEVSRAFEGATP